MLAAEQSRLLAIAIKLPTSVTDYTISIRKDFYRSMNK